MSTEFEQDRGLAEAIDRVLATPDFESFRTFRVKVSSCLKVKQDEDGEYVRSPGGPTQLKKVSGHYTAFMSEHYVLVYDAYHWHNFVQSREANIHKALMHVKISQSQSGEMKLGTRPPDVQEFTATLRRYGAYNDELRTLILAAQDVATLIQ